MHSFLHVHTDTHVVINALPHDVLASCMLVGLNIWCVYVESLLNICILLYIWLLVFIHIYFYPLLT